MIVKGTKNIGTTYWYSTSYLLRKKLEWNTKCHFKILIQISLGMIPEISGGKMTFFFGEKKVKKLRIYFFQISGSKSILKIHRKKFSPLLFLNLATASLDTSTLIQLFDFCKICIFSSQLIQFSLLFTTDSLTIKWIEAAVAAAVAIAEAILLQHISGGREKFKNNPGQKKNSWNQINQFRILLYLPKMENCIQV